ncbi:collagenase 3-like [Antedon mediterranea]|uniref:collagenase 3-like n=1 Tax=Antedon mediterranea TaxID=105859 RepID=UPI003AF87099
MAKLIVYLIQAFICLTVISSTSRLLSKREEDFLEQFGYLSPKKDGEERSNEELRQGLLSFQKYFYLEETGNMTDETSALMAKPRCGSPDKEINKLSRYLSTGYKWTGTSLTYNYLNYSSDLTENETRQTIENALKIWSDVTPLEFTEVSEDGDIKILFQGGDHGDDYPFDGPFGVLAHAFYPTGSVLAGDAHFDEDEDFTINGEIGIDLFQVAAHEFGHSLGLDHSTNETALMYPYYTGYIADFELSQDDIDGIQSIYGMFS